VEAVTTEISKGVDLVQAEFVEMLSLGPWLPARIPKLFIHHQLHFVYLQRFVATMKTGNYGGYLDAMMRVHEEAFLPKFDGVIVFSEEDKRALQERLQIKHVFVSPFPISVGRAAKNDELVSPRFSFVGWEEHLPNGDGLGWLLAEIWPEILRQIPDCTLQIIGAWSDAARVRYSAPRVEFSGYVPDLPAILKGSIMLVPIRIGSGIRVKVLDALAQGIPVVSTSIGCEGIPVVNGANILIRDDEKAFAAAAIELCKDKDLRRNLGISGKALVTQHYSPEEVRRRRNGIYDALLCSHSSARS
jgi:glycosyltransferase involved in cell wall biosynthesis